MLKSSRFSNTKGFSLVELMVVVAIIGILAAIAVPSVSKYMAKARQSEAKSNLASLYTAEKAFFAEYNTFDTRFASIGYTPEGMLRYDVGFTDVGIQAGPANGYNTVPANVAINATAYCGAAGVINANGCAMLNGADGAPPVLNGGTTCGASCTTTVNTFIAGAAASIQSSAANLDQWSINELKVLTNTVIGIQ